MSKSLPVILFLLIVASPLHSAVSADSTLPSIDVVDSLLTDSLSLHGQVVYVDFWASWCVPCRMSYPWLNRMQRRLETQGLTVVGVNVDRDRTAADAFLSRSDSALRVLYDPEGKLARRYHLDKLPASYIYGRDGHVKHQTFGFGEADTLRLEKLVRSLLEEESPQ